MPSTSFKKKTMIAVFATLDIFLNSILITFPFIEIEKIVEFTADHPVLIFKFWDSQCYSIFNLHA